jgi:Glycosyl transferase family 11
MTVITYKELGQRGRLGNALFEICSSIGIARHYNVECRFPPTWLHRSFFSFPDEMFASNFPTEAMTNAYEMDICSHLDMRCRAYLQDVAFFEPYLDEIKTYLQPSQSALAVLGTLRPDPYPWESLGVHVRRGDNVFDPGVPNKGDYFVVPTEGYYRAAMRKLEARFYKDILVCSDDLPWATEHIPHTRKGTGEAYWKEHEGLFGQEVPRDWIDFFLLAGCDSLVLSNSTFGIMAAFASGSPYVARPSKVYGPALSYVDEELMFADNWRVVDWDAAQS